MKKIGLFLFPLFFVNGGHADEINRILCEEFYSKNPGAFIHKKFFDEVAEKSFNSKIGDVKEGLNVCNELLSPVLAAVLSTILVKYGLYGMLPVGVEGICSLYRLIELLTGVAGGSLVAFGVYKLFEKLVAKIPEKDHARGCVAVLRDFLENWRDYKKCTPEKFRDAFDKLSKQYRVDPDNEIFNAKACEMVDHLRAVIDGKGQL